MSKDIDSIVREAIAERVENALAPRPYETLQYLSADGHEERLDFMTRAQRGLLAGALAVVVVAVGLVAAVNLGSSSTTEVATGQSTPTSESTEFPAVSNPAPESTELAGHDESLRNVDLLRTTLEADRVITRKSGLTFVSGDDTREARVFEADTWTTVGDDAFARSQGGVINLNGDIVCELNLEGDFVQVVDYMMFNSSLILVLENQRLLEEPGELAGAELQRSEYSCETGQNVAVLNEATVTRTAESTTITRLYGSTALVEQREAGDSPLVVSVDNGPLLFNQDAQAFSYNVSEDQQTLYYTSYSGTGAADSPQSVTAVDIGSGQTLWTLNEPGEIVDEYNGQVVLQTFGPFDNSSGTFEPLDVLLVNASTGATEATFETKDLVVSID